MKYPDKDDFPILHHLDGFAPTKSASLHTQRVQFMRIRRGERSEKTSQYLGVSRDSRPPHRWRVVITNQDAGLHKVHLGSFATEELAARAYDIVSQASYGVDGITNFPVEWYSQIPGSQWARSLVDRFASGSPADVETAREALARLSVSMQTRSKGRQHGR